MYRSSRDILCFDTFGAELRYCEVVVGSKSNSNKDVAKSCVYFKKPSIVTAMLKDQRVLQWRRDNISR